MDDAENHLSKGSRAARLLGIVAVLILSPLVLAVVIGGNLTSPHVWPWLLHNVAPITTVLILGWVVVTRWVLPISVSSRWYWTLLRVLAFLLLGSTLMAGLIGGDFWTIINLFRAAPYLGGLAVVMLVMRALYRKYRMRERPFGGALRLLGAQGLLLLAVVAQFLLFIPVANLHLEWQKAYCEAYIVPAIEAYKEREQRMPAKLAEALAPGSYIPPDVEYIEGSLRLQYRADLMNDYVYRTKNTWVMF